VIIEIPLVELHATVANVAVAALSRMLRSRASVPGGDMAGSKLVGSGEKRLAARFDAAPTRRSVSLVSCAR